MKTIIVILVLITIVVIATLVVRIKRKQDKLDSEANRDRKPPEDKNLFNGVVLSDRRGSVVDEDDGWYKGVVVGRNLAIISSHSNPRKGIRIHTYDVYGKRHENTVSHVEKVGIDSALVTLTAPWPESVRIWEIGRPGEVVWVMHKDGKWSRKEVEDIENGLIHLDMSPLKAERYLVMGESGLPWKNQKGQVVGHTFRIQLEQSPIYYAFKPKITR